MKPILFKNDDGSMTSVNPLWIRDVDLKHAEYNDDWCLIICLVGREHQNNVITRAYKTYEEAKLAFEYVNACSEINL